jgi:hypothetical protein
LHSLLRALLIFLAGAAFFAWTELYLRSRGESSERNVGTFSSFGSALVSEPATASTSPTGAWFPHTLESTWFHLATDSTVPLDELAAVAEKTRARMRAWLDIPEGDRTAERPFEIYVCKSADAVTAVERLHGLRPWRETYPWLEFPGFCSSSQRLILIPTQEDVAWDRELVAHEVSHAVLDDHVPNQNEFVDEGLAVLVADWITNSEHASPELASSSQWKYEAACARLSFNRTVPSLKDQLEMSWTAFQYPPERANHFALAWSFAKLLVEDRGQRFARSYRNFLKLLSVGEEPWWAFCHTYDEREVERAWRAQLARWTEWEAQSGDWKVSGECLFSLRATSTGSSSVLSRTPVQTGVPFRLGFRALGAPPPGQSVGIVIADREREGCIAARILDGGARVAISEKRVAETDAQGEWIDRVIEEVPCELVYQDKWVELRCDEHGHVRFLVDGLMLASDDLGDRAFEGRVGWLVEHRTGSPVQSRAGADVFKDVFVQR